MQNISMGKVIKVDFRAASQSKPELDFKEDNCRDQNISAWEENYYRDWSLADLRKETIRFSGILRSLDGSLSIEICEYGIQLYEALAHHAESEEIRDQALRVAFRLRQNIEGLHEPDGAA